jgi:hypothetical protein
MAKASEVEIRFTAEGPETALVELEHSKLERHGEGYDQLRAIFDGPWRLGRHSGAVRQSGTRRPIIRIPIMMKPALFLRIAAVLTFIHAALHTIGGVFGKPGPGPATAAVQAMKMNQFLLMGHTRELLGFLSRARAGGHDIFYGRGGSVLATGLAGKDGRAAAAADSGYVFGCVRRAGGELVRLLLSGAGDCGDLHRGVPRVGDCYR